MSCRKFIACLADLLQDTKPFEQERCVPERLRVHVPAAHDLDEGLSFGI